MRICNSKRHQYDNSAYPRCPECKRERERKRYWVDPDNQRKLNRMSQRKWVAANPDKVRDRTKKWAEANVDKKLENDNKSRKTRVAADPHKARVSARHTSRKRLYNITPERWEQIFDAQGRICAICKSPDPKSKLDWNTDHCHKIGKVRGVLCRPCNTGLGNFEDNLLFLQAAAEYLTQHA